MTVNEFLRRPLAVTAARGSFSMRCVECGLLLSEAEEAAGLLCTYCERKKERAVSHPGYLRRCTLPLCPAEFHALRGSTAGWRMGRNGLLAASYFCPEHVPVVMDHTPAWLREGPVTGTRCTCGWTWTPAEQAPLGDHLQAWLLHLRPGREDVPGGDGP